MTHVDDGPRRPAYAQRLFDVERRALRDERVDVGEFAGSQALAGKAAATRSRAAAALQP